MLIKNPDNKTQVLDVAMEAGRLMRQYVRLTYRSARKYDTGLAIVVANPDDKNFGTNAARNIVLNFYVGLMVATLEAVQNARDMGVAGFVVAFNADEMAELTPEDHERVWEMEAHRFDPEASPPEGFSTWEAYYDERF
jgi:hypothetical protein